VLTRLAIQEQWDADIRLASVLGRLGAALSLRRGRVVCGWCGRLLRLTREADGVTTGICRECAAHEYRALGRPHA